MDGFDSYVIRPFRLFDSRTTRRIAVAVCEPEEAEWWTLFGRHGDQAEPLGDFARREEAEAARCRLTGQPFPGF